MVPTFFPAPRQLPSTLLCLVSQLVSLHYQMIVHPLSPRLLYFVRCQEDFPYRIELDFLLPGRGFRIESEHRLHFNNTTSLY